MRTIMIAAVVLVACETNESESLSPEPRPGVMKSQSVDGFPLSLPVGAVVREVRNQTTADKPRHHADAELEARVVGEVDEIVAFFSGQLAARGLTVESTEHARVDEKRPDAPQQNLMRLVGKKEGTQVYVVITPGRTGHKVQIALAGSL